MTVTVFDESGKRWYRIDKFSDEGSLVIRFVNEKNQCLAMLDYDCFFEMVEDFFKKHFVEDLTC